MISLFCFLFDDWRLEERLDSGEREDEEASRTSQLAETNTSQQTGGRGRGDKMTGDEIYELGV